MNNFLIVFLRIITIMSLLLVVNLLLTGKRLVGEMPLFDFLVVITMGSLVGADIADPKVAHLPTIFAVVVLGLFQFLMNKLILNSRRFASLVTFEPTLVMENGRFLIDNMKKIRYTLNEVLMLMREKDIFNLTEVQYAIIEPNGKLTVLKKAQMLPLTPKDMGIQVAANEIPIPVIIEGKLDKAGMKSAGLESDEIIGLMKAQGYNQVCAIFFATYSHQLGLQIFPYTQSHGKMDIKH